MKSMKKIIVSSILITGLLLTLLLLISACSGGSTLTGNALNAAPLPDKAALGKPAKPPPDITPPAAVTDLSVTGANFYSISLSWTATGDDGMTGQATSYDIRYSTAPITADNWANAQRGSYTWTISPPGLPGSTETYTFYRVFRNTHYYIAMKVGDEAYNFSGLSNLAEVSTPDEPYTWTFQSVESGSALNIGDLAYDPLDGNPSIVCSDDLNNSHKYAHWNGSSWATELMNDNMTADNHACRLAFNPLGVNTDRNPTVCLGAVSLLHWSEGSQSWVSENALGSVYTDLWSMAYGPNDDHPSVSCVTSTRRALTSAVQLAQWRNSAWEFEYVAPHYGNLVTRTSLAFNGDGDAFIAYRDTSSPTEVLKLATRQHGTSAWVISNVDLLLDAPDGSAGWKLRDPSVVCNPITGYPGIAYRVVTYNLPSYNTTANEVRYASWNGSSWDISKVDIAGIYTFYGGSLAYDSSGTPCIAYLIWGRVKYAKWNGAGWDIEIVDSGDGFSTGTVPLAFNPTTDKPSIVMATHNGSSDLFFARKN